MKIINPTTFYEELITNGDKSLYAANNSKIGEDGLFKDILNLQIYNKGGEWLENQKNEFNTLNDVDEVTYGNFEYIGTVLDDTSYIVEQYTEIFKLEVLALEKDRDEVIDLFDNYAASLNNLEMTIDNNDIYITLGEFSTPTYGEKQDIGGCERFLVSLSVLCRVSSSLVTSKDIDFDIYNPGIIDEETGVTTGAGWEKIKYVTFNLRRDSEVNVDTTAGVEKKYDISKTDMSLTIGTVHTGDTYLNRKVFEYLLMINEDNMSDIIKIRYKDNVLNLTKEFEMYIVSAAPSNQYGASISYTVSFKLKND